MQKQVDKLIPRCRCITKPVNAHAAREHTATQTHSSEHRLGKKKRRSVNTALDTRRHRASQWLCRTHALKPLRHILHVKRERKKRKRGRDEMKGDAKNKSVRFTRWNKDEQGKS